MNKAKRARLNAAGGWGNRSPIPHVARALESISANPARFHAATRYSETAGLASIRELIADKLDGEVFGRRGVSFDNVTLSGGGATQLGFQALMLFGGPVLVTDPVYANYLDQAELVGLDVMQLVVVGPNGEFLPRENPNLIIASFQKQCRMRRPAAVFIVSPDNPTGYIWPDDVLDRLIGTANGFDVPVVLDRSYAPFFFGQRPDHLSWTPATHGNLIALESFSKSFSLLGLRVGYAIAPKKISAHLQALTQRISLCPGTLEQTALADFLSLATGEEIALYFEESRQAYRKSFLLARATLLKECPDAEVINADGGFYLVIRVPEADPDDVRFCNSLFDDCSVLTVPGSAFGKSMRGWIRTAHAPHVDDPLQLAVVYQTIGEHLETWRLRNRSRSIVVPA